MTNENVTAGATIGQQRTANARAARKRKAKERAIDRAIALLIEEGYHVAGPR